MESNIEDMKIYLIFWLHAFELSTFTVNPAFELFEAVWDPELALGVYHEEVEAVLVTISVERVLRLGRLLVGPVGARDNRCNITIGEAGIEVIGIKAKTC